MMCWTNYYKLYKNDILIHVTYIALDLHFTTRSRCRCKGKVMLLLLLLHDDDDDDDGRRRRRRRTTTTTTILIIVPQVACWAVYPGRQVQTALRQTELISRHSLSTVHDCVNSLFAATTSIHTNYHWRRFSGLSSKPHILSPLIAVA